MSNKLKWYALQVKSRHEASVASMLRAKGFEEFTPLHSAVCNRSFHRKTNRSPLFPGYVFCRCNLDNVYGTKVITTPGVIRIIGNGEKAISIPDDEIEAIQSLMQSELTLTQETVFSTGQTIRLIDGPLRGITGYVLRSDYDLKLIISITLIQRSVAVAIDRRWVTRVGLPNTYSEDVNI